MKDRHRDPRIMSRVHAEATLYIIRLELRCCQSHPHAVDSGFGLRYAGGDVAGDTAQSREEPRTVSQYERIGNRSWYGSGLREIRGKVAGAIIQCCSPFMEEARQRGTGPQRFGAGDPVGYPVG